MFNAEARAEITKIAHKMGLEPATLLAVAEVESGGKTSAIVNNRHEPLIRFEGHYFHRLLKGGQRTRAVNAGLAHSSAGRIKNPRGQVRRWALLKKAIRINRIAALSSVSWGIGQVMGSHWQWLGYGSADALVQEARDGIAGQVRLMARFIQKSGLVSKLKSSSWAAFARTYNGPAYRKNRYDQKLAAAYARYANNKTPQPENSRKSPHPLLKSGSSGKAVIKLQNLLVKNGHGLKADGQFGPKTKAAVIEFPEFQRAGERRSGR